MPATFTQEEQDKLDAWVSAIRTLARQHRVAHREEVSLAIKFVRRTLVTESISSMVSKSAAYAKSAGIPSDEIVAIRTLIFD